ncbi:hypothetical protein BSKO_09947 [Bryopsis sp. KO-2023]|nr:hypothetical protein BSKO_09947 [Bryopsis sp. KO-2023]
MQSSFRALRIISHGRTVVCCSTLHPTSVPVGGCDSEMRVPSTSFSLKAHSLRCFTGGRFSDRNHGRLGDNVVVCGERKTKGEREGRRSQRRSMSDLRTLPGVGAKNEELLISKGIPTVERLKCLYVEKFKTRATDLENYLMKVVGIRKQYCASIAAHIIKQYGNEQESEKGTWDGRVTLSVEGNISSGKSTFLNWLSEEPLQVADICEVVPEPVSMWQSVGGNPNNNLLDRFYADAEKYAYEFQNYVFLTRLQQNRNTWQGSKPLRILERSVFSDRLVFVRAVHEARWLSDLQLELYDSWFNPMLREVPGLVPDGFIYLRAEPSTCMRRLKRRGRSEETSVDENYLAGLHHKHEEWFCGKKQNKTEGSRNGSSILSAADDFWPEVPSSLKDSVIWLGGEGMLRGDNPQKLPQEVHAAMNRVPALVLDCDEDIDVTRDLDAKKEYASKVNAYYNYVRNYRKSSQRFWATEGSEEMRRKWSLVNSSSFKDLEMAFPDGSLADLRLTLPHSNGSLSNGSRRQSVRTKSLTSLA